MLLILAKGCAMALNSKITRKYDNNYVQVEIGSNSKSARLYKLPADKVDEFTNEYKQNSSKMAWASTGLMMGAILATVMPTYFITAMNISNRVLKPVIGIAVAVAAGIGSIFISSSIERKSHSKLLNKYGAEEVTDVPATLPLK